MTTFSNNTDSILEKTVGVELSNINNKVLPNNLTTDTGGMTLLYESKGGARKKKYKKSERNQKRIVKSDPDESIPNEIRVQRGGKREKSKSKSKSKAKSKSKKSRSCKQKVINIYM